MKKISLSFLLLSSGLLSAQTLVNTEPEQRKVVLEEFTGIKCSACPQGHEVANEIMKAFPGKIIVVNIHAGTWASPSTGQPDFRTDYGNPLAWFAGAGGFPCGMVNRVKYSGSTLAGYREDWMSASTDIINSGDAKVNLGLSSTWDEGKRELTVDVEMYCVETITGTTKLNVYILESGVVGYQKTTSGSIPDYNHRKIFRDYISPEWGTELTQTTAGKLKTEQYTYTVDADWNIDSCEIVAFLTQSTDKYIYTGHKIKAKNATTVGMEEEVNEPALGIFPNPVGSSANLVFEVRNTAAVSYTIYDMKGTLVAERSLGTLPASFQNIVLDTKDFSEGLYILQLNTGTTQRSTRFVVQ